MNRKAIRHTLREKAPTEADDFLVLAGEFGSFTKRADNGNALTPILAITVDRSEGRFPAQFPAIGQATNGCFPMVTHSTPVK